MPLIKTNGINTYYEKKGKGKPIIFIHGITASGEAWKPQADYFSKKYTVITYDLRGHGKSGKSKTDYSIEQLAKDLHELITSLNVKKPVICGLSLGGMVAQSYAATYSGELGALILSDTFTKEPMAIITRLQKTLLPHSVLGKKSESIQAKIYLNMTNFLLKGIKPELKNKILGGFNSFDRHELYKHLDAIHRFNGTDLSKIKVPTLILLGSLEPSIVGEEAKKLSNGIAGSSRAVIDGSVHVSNLENAKQFNAELTRFFKKTGF